MKARDKDGVERGFPSFERGRPNIRAKRPRHFDCEAAAIETGVGGLVYEVENLERFLFGDSLPGWRHSLRVQASRRAAIDLGRDVDAALFEPIRQLIHGLVIRYINKLFVFG